jgi:hypothetical protein
MGSGYGSAARYESSVSEIFSEGARQAKTGRNNVLSPLLGMVFP